MPVQQRFSLHLSEFTFVGLDNYVRLFQDVKFGKSLVNTLMIVLVSVPFTCLFSLWVASAIYQMRQLYTSACAVWSICRWSRALWR